MIDATIKHQRQNNHSNCGAAAFAMLTGLSQQTSEGLCNTKVGGKRDGTYDHCALAAFRKLGLEAELIHLGCTFQEANWLEALSFHFPIYLSANFVDKRVSGGRVNRYHAVAVVDGMIHDPGEEEAVPVSAFESYFKKKMILLSMIVVGEERPNYGKQN